MLWRGVQVQVQVCKRRPPLPQPLRLLSRRARARRERARPRMAATRRRALIDGWLVASAELRRKRLPTVSPQDMRSNPGLKRRTGRGR